MDGDIYTEADFTGPIAFVTGSEGGISRLVKEKCDFRVSIPMKGGVSSTERFKCRSDTYV